MAIENKAKRGNRRKRAMRGREMSTWLIWNSWKSTSRRWRKCEKQAWNISKPENLSEAKNNAGGWHEALRKLMAKA